MISQTIVGDSSPLIALAQDSGIYIRQNLIDAVLRDVGELD